MGAPSAQVQSPQSSQPASKGAAQSASSEPGTGKGGQIASTSGQPQIGQPNANGNTGLAPIDPGYNVSPVFQDSTEPFDPGFIAQQDGKTNGNPYPNTIGNVGSVAGGPNGRPSGKGGGGNTARGGKA